MTDLGPAHSELAVLEAEEAAARVRVRAAEDALRSEWKLSEELLGPWWKRRDGKPKPTADQLEEWTGNLIAQVQERGLALALDDPGHRALSVVDPVRRRERRKAGRQLARAREALRGFKLANHDELLAEESAARTATLRDAINSDDFDAVRAALAEDAPGAHVPATHAAPRPTP